MTRLQPEQLGLSWPDVLSEQMGSHTIFGPGVREYRFHPTRDWRADLAYPAYGILVEIEGGIWPTTHKPCKGKGCKGCGFTGKRPGRHITPAGFLKDIEKYNAAAIGGWLLLRFTPQQVEQNEAIAALLEAIHAQTERVQALPAQRAGGSRRG